MNTVQPIRDEDALRRCFEIARAHDARRGKNETCWELLLSVGFSTSLRMDTLLKVLAPLGKTLAIVPLPPQA